jgi:GNAT superfamily N-acetyltransferase
MSISVHRKLPIKFSTLLSKIPDSLKPELGLPLKSEMDEFSRDFTQRKGILLLAYDAGRPVACLCAFRSKVHYVPKEWRIFRESVPVVSISGYEPFGGYVLPEYRSHGIFTLLGNVLADRMRNETLVAVIAHDKNSRLEAINFLSRALRATPEQVLSRYLDTIPEVDLLTLPVSYLDGIAAHLGAIEADAFPSYRLCMNATEQGQGEFLGYWIGSFAPVFSTLRARTVSERARR